jgi:hypothetical protein
MRALDPGIHAFATIRKQDVDGRAFSARHASRFRPAMTI